MHKTLLVMRQEISTTFSRRSYILFAFGIPLLAIFIVAGMKFIQGRSGNHAASGGSSSGMQTPSSLAREGFVDQSGVIRAIPEGFAADSVITPARGGLIAYPDEGQAKQALQAGEITAYYVIPADYVKRGKIFYVYPDTKSYLSDGQEWAIQWVLTVNLLENDLELADRVWNPVWRSSETSITASGQAASSRGEDCSHPGFTCRSNELIRFMPAIMVAILYMALLVSSNMLFNSLGAEKENRAIELLMVSLHPRQLLAGKTIALGIAGLVQTIAWLGTGFILLRLGRPILHLPDNFTFPIDILAWSLLLFVGGFFLYASLMAGVGALIPRMKEAGSASMIVLIPLMLGYMVGFISPLARASGALLPLVLSVFPLTAPVVMVMRLTDSQVPIWQVLLSVGLTYLSAYFTLQAAAAMFHAQNLLSGQPFSLGRYLRAMTGRV